MAYVQIYTGNGKGKTTAAIGLTIRALGAGKRVFFLQFMKEKKYSEHDILNQFKENLTLKTAGKPYFVVRKEDITQELLDQYGQSCVIFEQGNPPSEYLDMVKDAMTLARDAASSGNYDIVVLDELNCALFFELVSLSDVLHLIQSRADNTELVITGRGAPQKLIDSADLVTEFKEIKHYYNTGVQARRGIEM